MKRLIPVAVLFVLLLAAVVAKELARASLEGGSAGSEDFTPLAAQPFTAKDVAKLEVTAAGASAPAYVLARKADGIWEMTQPFRAPAHIGNVDKLSEGIASADAELRDFDLRPEDSVQVRLTDAQGKVLAHLGVGASTGQQGAFVRILEPQGKARGFATTTDIRGLLGLGRLDKDAVEPEAPKPAHFRDRDFPTVQLDKPKRIEIQAPGRRVVFEKKDDKWAVAEGGPGPAGVVNDTGLKQLLEHIGPEFKAKDLADPADLAKLGLAEPQHVVTVTLEDGSVKRIFGATDPSSDAFYVRLDAQQVPDIVYASTSWEWQRLFPTGAGLFTFATVDIPEETLGRIVVERSVERSVERNVGGSVERSGAERIEMTRDGTKPADDWKVVAPETTLVPRQSSLRSLGSLVRNVKPVDWIDAKDAGPVEVTVLAGPKGAADADLVAIRIGGKSPTGKDRLAILPKSPDRVLVLADSTVERLAVTATSLFEAKVFHGWTVDDLKSVRAEKVEGAGTAPLFTVENSDKGWTLVRGAETVPADFATTTKWVAAVLGLETREPEAASGTAPADEFVVTAEKKDGTTRRFVLSAVKDGKRLVTVGTLRFPTERTDLTAFPEPRNQ